MKSIWPIYSFLGNQTYYHILSIYPMIKYDPHLMIFAEDMSKFLDIIFRPYH